AASITVQLGELVIGNSYRVVLISGGSVVATSSFIAAATTNIVHFPGLAAGLYSATITTPAVSPLARAATLSASSNPVTLEDCEDLPTLAPPTIEAATGSCDVSGAAHRTI